MTESRQGRLLEWALVSLQGLIFLGIGLSALLPGPSVGSSWWAGSVLIGFGALGMFWSGKDLGRALTPLPRPNGAGLAGGGIFGYVRHPMYSAFVVTGLGVAVGSGRVWAYAFVAVLVIFVMVKSNVEEAYLVRAYPGYAEYAARTGKFIPGLGMRRP